MPTYEVTAPDGRTLLLEGDTPPTDADLDEIFGSMGQQQQSGPSTGAMVGGAAGLAALLGMGAKAAATPGGLGAKAMAFGGQLNALRQQAMLSGFAFPKSVLGGVGATVANALERKSTAPLQALLSGQTVRDIGSAFKGGRNLHAASAGTELPTWLSLPGRAMGAVDDAISNSLVRSGIGEAHRASIPKNLTGAAAEEWLKEKGREEAARALLQTPLRYEDKMNSQAARYFFPFRRTPFNQFFEGLAATGEHPGISAGYSAAGAVQGALESDEQYPVGAGFGIAASGKYGLPQAIGQIAGRTLAGGKGGGGIAGSALPTSEYGLTQGVTDPLRPYEKPAFLTMLEKLGLKRRDPR